jgi:hypothetical protein
VYFAATGQLVDAEGASQSENEANGTANVYLSEDGALSFIATVAAHDLASVDTAVGAGELEARVTPDGEEMLFAASTNITGYDNRDQATGEPDVELYLYSHDTDRTVCVSCDPDGERPAASIRHPLTFPLAAPYLPRTLSAGGQRVFFESANPLVPGAHAGVSNVFEYEDGKLYLLDAGLGGGAYFDDASAEGEDVYITTTERLAPQDRDDEYDVYDVRAGGGAVPTATAARCQGEGCQGALTASLDLPTASTEASIGDGNITTVAASTNKALLAAALRKCRKKHGHARKQCEGRAKAMAAKARRGTRGKLR